MKSETYTDLEKKQITDEDLYWIKYVSEMVNETPNDQELGEKLRNFVKKHKQ